MNKHVFLGLLAGAALAISSGYAFAGGKPKPMPPSVNNSCQHGSCNSYTDNGVEQDQGQGQEQQQNAYSNATNGDVGASSATSTSNRNIHIEFPRPVATATVPSMQHVCGLSESSGHSIGWNFFSTTSAKQIMDGICVAERQAMEMERTCKFRTATAIRTWIARNVTRSEEVGNVTVVLHDGELYEDDGMSPGKARTLHESMITYLDNANAANPWENERNYTMAQCIQVKRAMQKPRLIPGPQGVAGPQGKRGPRGYRGKAKLVPAIPLCNTCKN